MGRHGSNLMLLSSDRADKGTVGTRPDGLMTSARHQSKVSRRGEQLMFKSHKASQLHTLTKMPSCRHLNTLKGFGTYFQFQKTTGSQVRTRSEPVRKGSGICRTANGTDGPVRVKTPNPNPNLEFGKVRFGFGPRFGTGLFHH